MLAASLQSISVEMKADVALIAAMASTALRVLTGAAESPATLKNTAKRLNRQRAG